jgi:hypothetical protein
MAMRRMAEIGEEKPAAEGEREHPAEVGFGVVVLS